MHLISRTSVCTEPQPQGSLENVIVRVPSSSGQEGTSRMGLEQVYNRQPIVPSSEPRPKIKQRVWAGPKKITILLATRLRVPLVSKKGLKLTQSRTMDYIQFARSCMLAQILTISCKYFTQQCKFIISHLAPCCYY